MPYKTLKQDCERSDGKSGKYVLKVKPKPGKFKGRKRDSKGFVRIGCHPSKDSAAKQRAAIEAPPREGVAMKITAGELRSIIKEELGLLNEQSVPLDMVERLNSAMSSIAEFVMDKYEEDDTGEGISATESILQDEIAGFISSLIEASDNDPDTDNDGDLDSAEIRNMIKTIGDDLEEETA